MRNFKREIDSLESSLKEIKSSLKTAEKCTQKFLNECGKDGIKRVSIGVSSKKVPASDKFCFGASGSVFQFPSGTRGKDGYIAIWGALERAGMSGGCGNSDQHQVSGDDLIEGVFELSNKTWRKIE